MSLADRSRAGDRRALARLISQLEADEASAREAVAALAELSSPGLCVGITGPPGSGKSTLIDALIGHWRGADRRVAVLAIDPSSVRSGGATLGDRIRMTRHHADPGVFIRSMASRGQLGGLAGAAAQAVRLLAALYEVVLVETVGVGQSEVDVRRLVDVVVVLQVAGLGDQVQLLKAGLLEVADIIAVTRADVPGAAAFATQLRSQFAQTGLESPPHILSVSATTGEGMQELVAAIEREGGRRSADSASQLLEPSWLRAAVLDEVRHRLDRMPLVQEVAGLVASGALSREAAVGLVLGALAEV